MMTDVHLSTSPTLKKGQRQTYQSKSNRSLLTLKSVTVEHSHKTMMQTPKDGNACSVRQIPFSENRNYLLIKENFMETLVMFAQYAKPTSLVKKSLPNTSVNPKILVMLKKMLRKQHPELIRKSRPT